MDSLLPFRPWRFADGDLSRAASIAQPERKPDDRSPFVRYARAAAQWAEWVREGIVVPTDSETFPVVESQGHTFRYGILPLDRLRPLVSVLPSAKEHAQRLLEGVQVYLDPIIVTEQADGRYLVVGQPELFEAARCYQAEVARPGKVRSSDYCMVAVVDSSYMDSLQSRSLAFQSSKPFETIQADLLRSGYVLSPRHDDPHDLTIYLDGNVFCKSKSADSNWKSVLVQILGIKSLDIGTFNEESEGSTSGKKIVLTTPAVSVGVHDLGTEYPYGSVIANNIPVRGVAMWSLRDFSTG